MTKLHELANLGQSIWYDDIQRSFITSGKLQALIDQGLRGITSNPSIFQKAISGSTDYDDDFRKEAEAEKSVGEIYEALALKDITMAADLLKPVYDATDAVDGYVSLEVNPSLAHDTPKTVSEAKRLFETVGRPNVMIKVPSTTAGILASSELIGAGVNINVTLLFSIGYYKSVANAHLKGLEILAKNGPSVTGGLEVDKVASVASFFVSRIDTAVDTALEKIGNKSLQGKIAIANAKMAYHQFEKISLSLRWQDLQKKGARIQRVLWASTGTKNPLYPDTLYVDQLIGQNTINTMPPATLKSFIDHGRAALSIHEGFEEAKAQLEQLTDLDIDLNAVTQKLQEEGVAAFAKSFDTLMESISEKRDRLLASGKA